MKKAIVIILMILPFLLIYFISFTGQVLSKYTHINVERIAVVNDVGDEYKENDYIKIGLNDEFTLRVKVYPELASNKKVSITNSNKKVCTIDESSMKVTGLDYGEATFVITSVDRHFVQYVINIKVAEDKMTDFVLSKTEVEIAIGKSEEIGVQVVPSTALSKYRDLIWESEDVTVAKVSQNGVITGVNIGETRIKVRSKIFEIDDEEIVKYIDVKVTLDLGKGVWFNTGTTIGKLYKVTNAKFDLKAITIINKLTDCTFDDIYYTIETGYTSEQIDASELDDGIIIFKKNIAIKVSLHANITDGNKYDSIRIVFEG